MKKFSIAVLLLVLISWQVATAQTFDLTGIGDGYACRGTLTCSPVATPKPFDPPTHLHAYNLQAGQAVVVTCTGHEVTIFYQYENQIAVTCGAPKIVVTPTVTPTVSLPTVTPTPTATFIPTPTHTPTAVPTVQVSRTLSITVDTSVLQGMPTQPFAVQNVLIQSGASGSEGRSLLRFDFSPVPTDARVISATLTLYTAKVLFAERQLMVSSTDSTWNSNTTWNTFPTNEYLPPIGGFFWRAGSPVGTRYDISLFWTESIRNGLVLARLDGLGDRTEFHSSEAINPLFRPKLTIIYEVP